MKMVDLVKATRSYRRFQQTPISEQMLLDLVDLARNTASGGNIQPLKYILSTTPDMNDLIFPSLAWAGYIEDWDGPETGQRPTAYIVVLCDQRIAAKGGSDIGIVAQTIALGAAEKGIGACMIGSVSRTELQAALSIPGHFRIELVIALGAPGESIVLEDVRSDGDIKYYRDEEGFHHVPKRTLADIVLRKRQA